MNKHRYKINDFTLNGGYGELTHYDNPTWPPIINKIIILQPSNSTLWYRGKIRSIIWNGLACVVKLNSKYQYVEGAFRNYKSLNYGVGYMLLLPTYYWQYEKTNDVLDLDLHHPKTDSTFITNILTDEDRQMREQMAERTEEFKKKAKEDKIPHTHFPMTIPDFQEEITNNESYDTLLSKGKGKYFTEDSINIILSNSKEILRSLPYKQVQLLKSKLDSFETITKDDRMYIVNRNIAIKNLIIDPADEINEGEKIMNLINKTLVDKLFTDIKCGIHQGYVNIYRIGSNTGDTITKELVPSLNYLSWQYDKPIDYHTLKYMIFQNDYQQNITENLIQKKEAENILSQEFIIALQPRPEYQIWCLKRLLICWYGDESLETNIRKIKILINQFRADPNSDYNYVNGILPSIMIYPKYGSESARIVLSKLDYYFSLYVDESKSDRNINIQWIDSSPTYFVKKNGLIYYTNGSIDLKMYIKASLDDGSLEVTSLSKDLTEFLNADDIMSI
jgi:hypothetical protein